MSEAEQQLLQLLKDRAFQRAAEGQTYRLASGATSDYYIDGKMVQLHPLGAYLIGEVLYERTQDLGVDAIGGLEVGAVPPTTAAVISYHRHRRHIEGFWVRDEVKRHGTAKLIEGRLLPRSRVVIVDDVVTEGKSVIKAVTGVREIGCEVVQVLALVDRLAGARELFRQHGIEAYRPIFTVLDLGVDPDVRRATAVAP